MLFNVSFNPGMLGVMYLKSIVWTYDTFENNFGMEHKFKEYLK